MLEIFRDNLYIHCDTSTVPYQGSVNVPIKLTEINSQDSYSDYAIQPKVSYHDGTSWQSVLLPFEDGKFSLPTNVFAENGIKKIAIGLIKDDKEYVTNDLKIIVNSAPTGTLVLPLSPQWNELVDAYLKQTFASQEEMYTTLIDAMKERLDSLEGESEAHLNDLASSLRESLEQLAESYKEIYNQAIVEFQPITDEEILEMLEVEDE